MTNAESPIAALLAQGDGQGLALLRGNVRADALAETLAALANAQGGTVLLGVGRGGKPEGVADADLARALVLDAALLCTPPLLLPLPTAVQLADTTLLLAEVPSGLPHVFAVRGRYLRREGAADAPLAPEALRALLLARGQGGWDRQLPTGATIEDLDPARIASYARRIGPAAESDVQGFLVRRGCLVREADGLRPTNAGLLLFAADIERWFPQVELTLVRYRGRAMSDEFLREDLRETLPEALRRAELWVNEHMRRGSRMRGLERDDWTQFPPAAVREVLVNAVAHRDYTVRGEGIRVVMFADRLECYSPGRLAGHVTLSNIVEERFSRNETLVQVLADLGLIERLGYGIDRVLRQMADAGLPAPSFRETAGGFLVTLPGHTGDDRTDVAGTDTTEWRRMGLNERQIAAMQLASVGRVGNSDLQAKYPEVSPETLRRDLADLVERGLLLRVGEKRGAYYIVK